MDALRSFLLSVLLLPLFSLLITGHAHNITEILAASPEYSLFNGYLSQTKLADEINSRQTITVLVFQNSEMSNLVAKRPLAAIKDALCLHVLLDYYDAQKLHRISEGTTLTTTLYQATGKATGNLGFVNITDLRGGKVGFGSGAPGSKLDSTYSKSVKEIPYNISVLEISAPIISPGLLTAASESEVNITATLEKAGSKTFASLLETSGVIKTYESTAQKGGLTIFAPSDEAFKAERVPDLSKLKNAELVSLLEFHAVADYEPKGTLKTLRDPIPTLATNGAGTFDLTTTTEGDEVTLHTGIGSSRIAGTRIDSPPLAIFTVDDVLLPPELFAKSPSPAPSPAPVTAPSPSPVAVPTPSPTSDAPSPMASSPPAPATETPDGEPSDSPADAPGEESLASSPAGDADTLSSSLALHTALVAALSTALLP